MALYESVPASGHFASLREGVVPPEMMTTTPAAATVAQITTTSKIPNELSIRFGFGTGPYGKYVAAVSDHGICWLDLRPGSNPQEAIAAAFPRATVSRADRLVASVIEQLGNQAYSDLPLHLIGTPFQLRVWQALLAVPSGSCISYGNLARNLGMPRAARVIGSAVAANRIALLVPCHRVVLANRHIGGFRWGAALKAAILADEAAALPGLLQPAA